MSDILLEVKNLKTYFYTEDGIARAVDGMDFIIRKGETLGMIGESGCGKSVSALSIMQLVASPPGKIIEGEIWFEGEDLLKKSPSEIKKIRGNDISMIFQEPMTSLNPVFTIGNQIMEPIILHQKLDKKKALKKAIEMLDLVGISSPEKQIDNYPHQLSGGMRQRAMIAQAIAGDPKLIIADEPTSNLDVTLQARIIELFKKLKDELKLSILLITHDLGMVEHMADHVAVMTQGKIVESGTTRDVLSNPKHGYTKGLMEALL